MLPPAGASSSASASAAAAAAAIAAVKFRDLTAACAGGEFVIGEMVNDDGDDGDDGGSGKLKYA